MHTFNFKYEAVENIFGSGQGNYFWVGPGWGIFNRGMRYFFHRISGIKIHEKSQTKHEVESLLFLLACCMM